VGGKYRLKPLPCREVRRVLKRLGFEPEKQEGSHEKWRKHDGNTLRKVTLACHNGEVKAKDLKSIFSQAGVDKKTFLDEL